MHIVLCGVISKRLPRRPASRQALALASLSPDGRYLFYTTFRAGTSDLRWVSTSDLRWVSTSVLDALREHAMR